MKIYVAGSFKDRTRIRLIWMDKLEQMGYTITHDWTLAEADRYDKDNKPVRDIPYHKKCAQDDVNGVLHADVVVGIFDNSCSITNYRGTNFELGLAIGAKIPVILYDPWYHPTDISKNVKISTNVFYWLPSIIHVNNAQDLLLELEKLKT